MLRLGGEILDTSHIILTHTIAWHSCGTAWAINNHIRKICITASLRKPTQFRRINSYIFRRWVRLSRSQQLQQVCQFSAANFSEKTTDAFGKWVFLIFFIFDVFDNTLTSGAAKWERSSAQAEVPPAPTALKRVCYLVISCNLVIFTLASQ